MKQDMLTRAGVNASEHLPILVNEDHTSLSLDAQTVRFGLIDQLRTLPPEAFARLQYLQPQVGCFNRCAFCSQVAGKDVWQLPLESLEHLDRCDCIRPTRTRHRYAFTRWSPTRESPTRNGVPVSRQ
jgi:hypothetical protein